MCVLFSFQCHIERKGLILCSKNKFSDGLGGQNSAREMSLALGQNPSYINRIENGKALPSMQGFFSICEYLQITPGDFFNEDSEAPREVRELLEKIEMLTPEQRTLIRQVVEQFLGE